MAKRSKKSLSTLIARLSDQQKIIDKLETQNKNLSADGIDGRLSRLEKELYSTMSLAAAMVAVNKEYVARLSAPSTTTTARAKQSVRRDDAPVDILNKMYSFFVRNKEEEKKQMELEKDFAQERVSESRRRKPTKSATKLDKKVDKPSSNPILSLLGFIFDGVKGIATFITGGLVGIIAGGLKGIRNIIGGVLSGILSRIPGGGVILKLGEAVTSIFGFISKLSAGLGSFVLSVIKSSAGLIMKIITPSIIQIVKTAFSLAGIGVGSLGRLGATILSNPVGLMGAAIGTTYYGLKYGLDAEEKLLFGDEVYNLKQRKIQLQKELERSVGTGINPERDASRRKEIADIDQQIPSAYEKYLNDVVIPAMSEAGYTLGSYNAPEPTTQHPIPATNPHLAFERVDENGNVEQVFYRRMTDLLSTESRNSPKEAVSIKDQSIMEGNILKHKGGQAITQEIEKDVGKLGAYKEDFSRIAEEQSRQFLDAAGISDVKQKISDVQQVLPSPPPAPLPAPTIPTNAIPNQIPKEDVSASVDIGKTEVVKVPTKVATASSDTEYTGSPSVRNPTLFRTAVGNNRAIL